MAATASKGEILGKVSFLVSRLLESGKKRPNTLRAWGAYGGRGVGKK